MIIGIIVVTLYLRKSELMLSFAKVTYILLSVRAEILTWLCEEFLCDDLYSLVWVPLPCCPKEVLTLAISIQKKGRYAVMVMIAKKKKAVKQNSFLYLEEKHPKNYAHVFMRMSVLTDFESSKGSCENLGDSKMLVSKAQGIWV